MQHFALKQMTITVAKEVVLGGHTFSPEVNPLTAQATDSRLATWLIGYQPGNSVCAVDIAELGLRQRENAIEFAWPDMRKESPAVRVTGLC